VHRPAILTLEFAVETDPVQGFKTYLKSLQTLCEPSGGIGLQATILHARRTPARPDAATGY